MTWHGSDRRSRLPGDWATRRRRVLKRDGWLCQLRSPGCTMVATEVDHIEPGDDHALTNLRATCSPCHAAKSAAEGVAARAAIRSRATRPAEAHPGWVGGSPGLSSP